MNRSYARRSADLLAVAAAVLIASPAGAQNFNPETGGNLITGTSVFATPGGQLGDQDDEIGSIGVAKCSELAADDGSRMTFSFEYDRSYRGTIQRDDQFMLEFSSEDGFRGACDRNRKDDCRRIKESNSDIRITESESTLEIEIDFDELLPFRDQRTETCSFGEGGTSNGGGDAGAGDGGMTDAGSGSFDAADRIYAARVFLTGQRVGNTSEEQHVVDAAFELDRTRPPAPSNVRVGALDSKIKVEFDEPQETGEIETYHVFFSSSSFGQSARPESLEARDDVTRRTLTGTSVEDGTVTGEVSNLDLESGSSIYIGVASRDEADNFSRVSRTSGSTTVRDAPNFSDRYHGSEEGGCGCSSTPLLPAGLWFGLICLGLVGFRRVRRAN